jgi:molybdate transport system ATP-binding protein
VDAPPIGALIDAAQIARNCDGTLLVINYNAVRKKELADACRQLNQSGCPILGTVINQAALDSYLKWQLELELMDTLKSFGGDVVFVSHDRDEVCRLCQSVCVLTDGTSEPKETVRRLMEAPGTVGAALLSGCKNYSRAERLDDHTVRCGDWGVTLRTAAEVPANVTAVGVRAHHIVPIAAGENDIPCTVVRVIEDAFSTVVMLATPGGNTGKTLLRLELDRGRWAALGGPDRLTVHIAPEQVMALTGGGV